MSHSPSPRPAPRGTLLVLGLVLLVLAHPVSAVARTTAGDTLEIDGARIYFEVAGHGPAVVLLHDGLTHSGLWDQTFRRLARRFRVVRYDRRGHGRSSVSSAPYRPVDDLRQLLDRLGLPRVALVGVSSGGRLALDFALASPDRVSHLVLIGPVVSGLGYSDHFLRRGRRHMAPLADGNLEAVVSNWSHDPHLVAQGNTEARSTLRALLRSHARKRFLERDPALARRTGPPALDRLPELGIPTLVVVGADDIAEVHAHAGAIQAGIRGARRIVVPDAGHLVPLERPDEILRLTVDLLEPPGIRPPMPADDPTGVRDGLALGLFACNIC